MSDRRSDMHLPIAPRGRRRRSAVGRVFGSLVGWAVLIVLGVSALGGWGYLRFTAPGIMAQERVLEIPEGSGRKEIAALLEENGIVSDAGIFSAAAAFGQLRGRSLKPGEYRFRANDSMEEVLALLMSGKVITYKITIPEGWTSEMAVARIRENEVLTGDIAAVPAEASLVADTIVFRRGMTRAKLVESMQSAQLNLIETLWKQKPADSPLNSIEEFLTLASIVERETGVPEERPMVAAVFLNRLKKGIRLQSDPTIVYGLVGGKGKLERAISRADIDSKTPYNTYQIDGLPPGPIAIPGRATLEAVMSPAKVEYLYFVADGTGGHAFATGLDEHNANVAKWRKIEDGIAPVVPEAIAPVVVPSAENSASGLENLPLDGEQASAPVVAPVVVAAQTEPVVEPDSVAEDLPVIALTPGSVIRVGTRLVPVPAPRKAKP